MKFWSARSVRARFDTAGGGTADDGAGPDAELLCMADRMAFPVRDGIPRMLVDEARRLDDSEIA